MPLDHLANDSRLNHRLPVTSGVREQECSVMLSDFFRALRARKKGGQLVEQL